MGISYICNAVELNADKRAGWPRLGLSVSPEISQHFNSRVQSNPNPAQRCWSHPGVLDEALSNRTFKSMQHDSTKLNSSNSGVTNDPCAVWPSGNGVNPN